jgi:hypothetical protein
MLVPRGQRDGTVTMPSSRSFCIRHAAGRVASAMLLMAGCAILASSIPGTAMARPDTRKMTCQQAQEFVRRSGAVVMSTGRYTYERIVTNQSYCEYDEITWLMVAPTKDVPNCRVGYYCRTRIDDDELFLRRR